MLCVAPIFLFYSLRPFILSAGNSQVSHAQTPITSIIHTVKRQPGRALRGRVKLSAELVNEIENHIVFFNDFWLLFKLVTSQR